MVILLLILSLLISSCSVNSLDKKVDTDSSIKIGGIISKNMVLAGRVTIEKDLLIAKGVLVEIEKATEIIVEKSDISRTEPIFLMPETEIVVEGTLIIKGSKEKPVRIYSSDSSDINWGGIIINGGSVKSENLEIRNSYNAFNVIKGSLYIKDFRITNNKIGISILDNESPSIIEKGHFSANESAVINNSEKSKFVDVLVENNEEGVLLKRCPDMILHLTSRKNHYGIITNTQCINFNLINMSIYENKNNIVFADFSN